MGKNFCSLFLALLIIIVFTSLAICEEQKKDKLDPEAMLKAANEKLAKNPDDLEAHVERAGLLASINFFVHEGKKDNIEAWKTVISDYNILLKHEPEDADMYANRGTAYFRVGEYDKAISDLTKMLELYPDDSQAYTKRGWAYDNAGKYAEAIADFSKLIEMRPSDEFAFLSRSEAYFHNKQYNESIADCSKVIERLHEIGNKKCEQEGIKKPAQEQLDKEIIGFLSIDPEFVGAYYTKGEAYEVLGNKDEAIKAYKEYIKYGKEGAATKSGLKEAENRIKVLEKK